MKTTRFILIFLVLSLSVFAVQEYAYDRGTIDHKGDVSKQFTRAIIKVSPEKSISYTNTSFEYNITIKNTHTIPIYFFFDFYLNDTITEHYTSLPGKLNQSRWDNNIHYYKIEGKLLNPEEQVIINYNFTTVKTKGKANIGIWASSVNDYSCKLTDSCLYYYVLDPTYETIIGAGGVASRDIGAGGTGTYGIGQSFSVTCGGYPTCLVNQINLSMDRVLNPVDNVRINITGNGTGTNITAWDLPNCRMSFAASGLGTSKNVANFTYLTGQNCILNASTKYNVIVDRTGAINAANYPRAEYLTAGGTANVAMYDSTTGGVFNQTANALVMNISVEPVVPDNYTVSVQNVTWVTPVYESSTNSFLINLSWGQNVSNISSANITYNNTVYLMSNLSNGSIGLNNTWRVFNASIQAPLVSANQTNITFNFTYYVQNNNGTNTLNTTSNFIQQVNQSLTNFTITIQNITWVTPSIETALNNFSLNFSYGGNVTTINFVILRYNNTNYSASKILNGTIPGLNHTWEVYYINVSAPFLVSGNTSEQTFNWTINSTVSNGTTQSITSATNNQTVYQMILNNCGSITNTTGIAYQIRDISTNTLVNATLNAAYTVWNQTQSLNRTYTVNTTNDAQPRTCRFPTFGVLNLLYDTTASASGYTTSSNTNQLLSLNTNVSSIIFLQNSSGSSDVIITVVDQDDVPQEGAQITIELYNSPGNFSLLYSATADFQGQHQFTLNTSYQYRINISTTSGDLYNLTSGSVASVGPFQILTSTLTFRVLTGAGSSLAPLIDILNMDHNLTFVNSTGVFTLQFQDLDRVASLVCLKVYNYTANTSSVFANNCTTANASTLNAYISDFNGSWTAYAIATSSADGRDYQFDSLSVYRNPAGIFGREGMVWSFLLIIAIACLGMVVTGGNPVGTIVGGLLGLGASTLLGFLSIGWTTFVGIGIVGGIIIYLMKT